MNKQAGWFILAAAAAGGVFLFTRQKPKASATDPRATTGTAMPFAETYDRLFAIRAQQPIVAGASGGNSLRSTLGSGGTIDLTPLFGLAVSAMKKLFGGAAQTSPQSSSAADRIAAAEGRLGMSGDFSTWDDLAAAKGASYAADQENKYGTVDEWYNGPTGNEGVNQDYGGSGLEQSYGNTTTLL